MAESLGDALLSLRTDDSQFDAGVARAEGKAKRLGGTLDKTSGSSARLAGELINTGKAADQLAIAEVKAGSATQALAAAQARASSATAVFKAQLKAGEITQESYNAKVLRTKVALDVLQSEYRKSVAALNSLSAAQKSGAVATGAQRSGMQQLGFQINDVATMYALGARPTQIFSSQISQVTQAVQLAMGGTSKLAGFLGGPWGVAITAATVVLAPFIAKLFETKDAAAEMRSELKKALETLNETLRQPSALGGTLTAAGKQRIDALGREARLQRDIAAQEEKRLRNQTGTGIKTAGEVQAELELKRLRSQLASAQKDIRAADDAVDEARQIEKVRGIQDQNQAVLDAKPGRPKKQTGPTEDELERRFEGQLVGITQQILSARRQVATSAEERAELEARSVEWDRIQTVAEIEADEKFNALQKDELVAAATRLADAELLAIERGKRVELERDAQQLSDQQFEAQRDALQLQFALADTEADRKRIALQMLAAEEAYLRSRLQSVILSDTANAAEKLRAQLALDALDATAAQRRESVARANETSVERFMRDLNRTPGQINEAVDKIQISGLDELNDQIVDTILNAKSLGDAFTSVANQIIADLLRIAIQQALIKPLAESLFGGGGGGLGGLFGKLFGVVAPSAALQGDFAGNVLGNPEFAGAFASGGLIPRGQFGIVGEAGPEPVFSTPGGAMVLPNSAMRKTGAGGAGGGTQVSIPISIDAAGADPAALERVRAQVAQLQRELPAIVVRTVQDAGDRRIFTTRNFR